MISCDLVCSCVRPVAKEMDPELLPVSAVEALYARLDTAASGAVPIATALQACVTAETGTHARAQTPD